MSGGLKAVIGRIDRRILAITIAASAFVDLLILLAVFYFGYDWVLGLVFGVFIPITFFLMALILSEKDMKKIMAAFEKQDKKLDSMDKKLDKLETMDKKLDKLDDIIETQVEMKDILKEIRDILRERLPERT